MRSMIEEEVNASICLNAPSTFTSVTPGPDFPDVKVEQHEDEVFSNNDSYSSDNSSGCPILL